MEGWRFSLQAGSAETTSQIPSAELPADTEVLQAESVASLSASLLAVMMAKPPSAGAPWSASAAGGWGAGLRW